MGWVNAGQVLVFRSDASNATIASSTFIMRDVFLGGTESNQDRVISTANVLPYNSSGHTLDGYIIGKRDTNNYIGKPSGWYDLYETRVTWNRIRGTIVTQKFRTFSGISQEWHFNAPSGEQIDFEGLFTNGVHTVVVVPRYKETEYTIEYRDQDDKKLGSSIYLPGIGSWLRSAITDREGYAHIRWQDYATGQLYTPGSNVTLTTMNDRIFIPVFSIINYSISYNNLQGTTHTNPSTYNIETNAINLSVPSNRPGYIFVGWYTALNGGTQVTQIASKSTGNKTYYARWSPIKYTITLNANGGNPVNNLEYYTNTNNVTLPSVTRVGHTLTSWSLISGPEAGSPSVVNNTLYPNGSYGNMTYGANWTPNKLNISYNLDGGPGNTPSSVQIPYNNTFQLAPAPADKPGYTFGGWEYNGEVRGASASVTPTDITDSIETRDVTVTMIAKWNIVIYTITIQSNGGNKVGGSTYTIESDTVTLNRPTRDGFKFDYWDRSSGPTEGDPIVEGNVVTLNGSYGNMTYRAIWTPNVMTIEYDLKGGVGTTPSTQTINYNNQFNLATNSQFSRSGYNFVGWVINDKDYNGGATALPTTLSSQIKDADVTLVASAKWSLISYTISFDSTGESSLNPLTYNMDTTTLTLPTNPTRTGHIFIRWDITTAPTSGTVVISGSNLQFTNAVGDLILTAVWDTDQYSIIWGDMGGSTAFPVTGELSDAKPTEYSVTSDTINPLSHIGDLVRPGWNTPVFTPTSIPKGSTGSVTFNITSWSPNNYTITVSSSGTGAGINNSTYTTSQNKDAGISRTLTRGSLLGYVHAGWSVTRTGTFGGDRPDITGDTLNIPSGSYGDITVTELFNINTYDIYYEYNGSTDYKVEGVLNNTPTTYNVNTDTIEYLKNTLNRKGWSFKTNWIQINGRTDSNNLIPQGSTGNKTVSIHWDPVTYAITTSNFESNTSIGVSNYSTLDTNSGNLIYNLTPGSKTGYRDLGWNLSRTDLYGGESPSITNDILTIPIGTYGSFNVNKIWVANTYKLRFTGVGIDGIGDITATYDVNVGNLPNPSRTGYTFNGWYLDGVLVTSTSKNLTSIHDAVVELTAGWTPITYTVAYQTNGVGTLSNKTATYDEELGTLPEPSKTGYVFNGWFSTNTDDNGSGTERTASSKNLRATPGVVTIYAKWTANTYTITYDVTKHTTPKTKSVTYITGDNDSPLKAATQQLVLDPAVEGGWDFVGRTVGSGFTYNHATNTLSISSGQTGNHSIGANWTPKTYVITRHTNKTNTTTINYQTSDTDQTITIPGPSQPGWTAGIKTVTPNTLSITGETGANSSTLTIPANHFGGITISTGWTGNTYTISINTNGGTEISNKSYTVSNTSQTVDILVDESLPVKDGHERRNWSIKNNPLLGVPTISNNQITIPANTYNNFVVEMLWDVEIYNYSVDFEGGSTANISGGYNIGTTVNLPFTPPIKVNQTLMGYSSNVIAGESGSSNVRSRFTPATGLISSGLNAINLPIGTYGNIELSAIWSSIYYRIIFDKNGASSGTMESQNKALEDNAPLFSNTYSETRYTFSGWARSANGPAEYVDGFNGNIRDENNNLPTSTDPQNPDEITLYAKWDARHIKVNDNIPSKILVNGNAVIIRTNVIIWNKDSKIA